MDLHQILSITTCLATCTVTCIVTCPIKKLATRFQIASFEPSQDNYKNTPKPNINNNPAIIIIKGAICLPSIGFSFICYSWGNRVPFGILLFTPI